MKYVIVKSFDIEAAILFPDFITHSQAVNRKQIKPISAGHYFLTPDGVVYTHGESTSLKLKSRPEDAEIIHRTIHCANSGHQFLNTEH